MTETEKEQTKLFANALDRASTACLAIGVLTPMSVLFFGQPAGSMAQLPQIRLGVVSWLFCAWLLHIAALRALRELTP
jgi:hypothetical protein